MTQVELSQSLPAAGPQDASPSWTPPLPHIDDLVALPADVDRNQSIKRLLEEADAALRRAEFSMALNRPAEALRDFVRASVIAVQYIAEHRDFPAMRTADSSETRHMHENLLKRIHKHSDTFDVIKRHIMLDNKRTGVPAKVPRRSPAGPRPLPSPAKKKPAVQPKPASLHGNAILPGRKMTIVEEGDLAARLANLKGPQPSPGQDARIKTYLLSATDGLSRAAGVPDGSVACQLPQQPPPIYARSAVGGFPASSPAVVPLRPHISSHASGPASNAPNDKDKTLTDMNICDVDDVKRCMRTKGSLLLIDLRPRLAFENGHFDWADIICIEPSVLLRSEAMSADDISASLVLGATDDQAKFDARSKYRDIIIYDQDTKPGDLRPRNNDECAIHNLLRALNAVPMESTRIQVLTGGLNAWMARHGQSQLRSTPADQRLQRSASTSSPIHTVRKLPDSEMNEWRRAVLSRPTRFPRTADHAASWRGQQSMMDRPAVLPNAPAPTVPRANSHYDSRYDAIGEAQGLPTMATAMLPNNILRTGLENPRNRCFMNSLLQALLTAPGLSTDLVKSHWVHEFGRVPRRINEGVDEPQLATRILANTLHWMDARIFKKMSTVTFAKYCNRVSQYNGMEDLGGEVQQDSREFFQFIMAAMHGETNLRRDAPETAPAPWQDGTSVTDYFKQERQNYDRQNNSLIDKHLLVASVVVRKCNAPGCGADLSSIAHSPLVDAPCLVHGSDSDRDVLHRTDALTTHLDARFLHHADSHYCPRCKALRENLPARTHIVPRSRILCMSFMRQHASNPMVKCWNTVTWDLDRFDLTPYTLPDTPPGSFVYRTFAVVSHAGTQDSGHYVAFVRDTTVPPAPGESEWLECSDEVVSRVRSEHLPARIWAGQGGNHPLLPYLVFMERL